jgi:Glycosyl transferases group 1
MHLVFVTSLVPGAEPTTGYEIANQSIVNALRRNGVKVTSLGFNWAGKGIKSTQDTVVLGEVDVRSETAGRGDKAGWVAKAFASQTTISSAKLRIVSAGDIRAALARIEPFDGYVINGVTLAGAFPDLFADKPSIYVAHNVEHKSAEENALSADTPLKRYFFRREAKLLRRIEFDRVGRAAHTLTLAEEDRADLGINSPPLSSVLPLVIGSVPPKNPSARSIKFDAGLIGTWTWQPNRVGLEWFVRQVVPLLPGDFSLAVAGHVPAGFDTLPANVKMLGRVADAAEFVRSCAVIPLVSQSGTGVQLKTIETFEFGLPSVATSRSLRGIGRLPANCRPADDPADFARHLSQAALETRAGNVPLANGSAFYAAQIAGQDSAVETALSHMRDRLAHLGKRAA